MFKRVRFRGSQEDRNTPPKIFWGNPHKPAVVFKTWSISKQSQGVWKLTGQAERVDTFAARQKPLVFTNAPRQFSYWPVVSLNITGSNQVVAILGQLEY